MADHTEHRWSLDSIEEGVARLEEDGERMISIPSYLLPEGVTEGQVLRVTRAPSSEKGTVVLTIAIDLTATAKARRTSKATMADAMAASKKHDPGGDVSL